MRHLISHILPCAARLLLEAATSAILALGVPLSGFPSATVGNIARNPSFEESDEKGDPAGWGWWGSEVGEMGAGELFQCEPDAHSGDWAVSIREEAWGSRGYWYTVLHAIKPHRWYVVSVWAKRDRPTGWVPEIQVFGQNRVMNLRQPNVWQRFDWLLDSGEFSGSAVLKLVNSRKPYKVWFDDIVVVEFWVEPSAWEKGGRLSWRSSFTSRLVVFEVEAARTVSFDAGLCSLGRTLNEEISFPDGLPPGEWFWRVKASQNDSLLAVSQPRSIEIEAPDKTRDTVFPPQEAIPSLRPESNDCISFDENLNIVVGGKPFFPIGIYGLPVEKFGEAKKAGFNTAWTDEVEAARRVGLRTIVSRGFRYIPGREKRPSRVEKREAGPTNHGQDAHATSADCWIIARYLWDEPDQTNASPRAVFDAHVTEKRADPYHPTAIVVYRPESFPAYASASDILMTDPYPIPHRPLTVVSESVRAAREAVREQKPVWAIIQAFNWAESSQEARRIGWARWPTFAEERCMAYLAVINGAKSILFYRYGGGEYDPNNWGAVKRVAGELKRISPILLSKTVSFPVSVAVESPSGDRDVSSRIEYVCKAGRGSTYLIAANNWPGKRRVIFSFEKPLRESINPAFENRRTRAEEQSFSDIFEAYGVHVYELSFR